MHSLCALLFNQNVVQFHFLIALLIKYLLYKVHLSVLLLTMSPYKRLNNKPRISSRSAENQNAEKNVDSFQDNEWSSAIHCPWEIINWLTRHKSKHPQLEVRRLCKVIILLLPTIFVSTALRINLKPFSLRSGLLQDIIFKVESTSLNLL